ncbi:tetratricopeptide repeat protein [Celeribacter sp.]|uniref:tetratricopeptide repeat protein n=1 Tax=Celeribacter sp. TaxID=1890673 RepID=UPI003A9185D6
MKTGNTSKLFALVVALCGLGSVPEVARAEVAAGAYLATRQATFENDFTELSHYATRALVSAPKDPQLLEALIAANMSRGEFAGNVAQARALLAQEPSNQAASMSLITTQFAEGNYDAVLETYAAGAAISPVVDEFVKSWALVGQGNIGAAFEGFDQAVKNEPAANFFAPYNNALAYTLVGDFETAEKLLAEDAVAQTRDSLLLRMQLLSQLERGNEALVLFDAMLGDTADPELISTRERLEAGERLPVTAISSAQDGLAEVFYAVALALTAGESDAFTLLYAQMALELRPDRAQYILLVGELLEKLENYELAAGVYAKMSSDDPNYHLAELGRARTLREAGREDAELEVLTQLSKNRPQIADVHVALGDALRRRDAHEEAVEAYTKAIDLVETPTRAQWPLFFTRGIAYERQGKWPKAEADLRKALELEPGQPSVLNYLGYSFLEMKINLDEAMDMIRRASNARPNDGYITDSLAWGLYRLGRYEEALPPMERAVELMPVDPIVNDHLGDVYWAVGREREARFQWQRAMSFDPEEKDAERIRRKLDIGLDRVLIEEGEEPTRPVNDR